MYCVVSIEYLYMLCSMDIMNEVRGHLVGVKSKTETTKSLTELGWLSKIVDLSSSNLTVQSRRERHKSIRKLRPEVKLLTPNETWLASGSWDLNHNDSEAYSQPWYPFRPRLHLGKESPENESPEGMISFPLLKLPKGEYIPNANWNYFAERKLIVGNYLSSGKVKRFQKDFIPLPSVYQEYISSPQDMDDYVHKRFSEELKKWNQRAPRCRKYGTDKSVKTCQFCDVLGNKYCSFCKEWNNRHFALEVHSARLPKIETTPGHLVAPQYRRALTIA